MAIKKQEFYEGAALHILARGGNIERLRYEAPFFALNDDLLIHMKYSTKIRSPWSFSFTSEETMLLERTSKRSKLVIGLICGSDGIATLPYGDFATVAASKRASIHLSAFRSHREHYEICGPNGTLDRRIPPSDWVRTLASQGWP